MKITKSIKAEFEKFMTDKNVFDILDLLIDCSYLNIYNTETVQEYITVELTDKILEKTLEVETKNESSI